MAETRDLYNQRITRLMKAIALEKPDRTPVMAWADTVCANYMGVKMSEFSSNPLLSAEVTKDFFKEFSTFDAAEMGLSTPDLVAMGFMSKMKIAGRDLPEGSPWIVDEQERIGPEAYDEILENGWMAFNAKFVSEKLGLDMMEIMGKVMETLPEMYQMFNDIGMPLYTTATGSGIPLETLAGGRTMAKFIQDLYRMPDKIQRVLDVMIEDQINMIRAVLGGEPKPISLFIGIARGAPEFLSPRLWRRFVEPYMVRVIETVIECGVVANLHFDSCWDRELDVLKQFPKGTCVFACDHSTDIYKLKEVLGDRMCIKGDVPSPMLAFGTPEDVYSYCTKLVRDMGNGFILAPACTIPANAKIENIKAMLQAASGE
jgi:uroporphyrinogen-III decarboxylase